MVCVACGFYFENGSVCLIRKTHPTTPLCIYRYVNNRLAYKFDPITRTDEEVGMYPLANLHWPEVYPTEHWLIPMAKDAISHGHIYSVQELL